jgi:PGF-CTERM protein
VFQFVDMGTYKSRAALAMSVVLVVSIVSGSAALGATRTGDLGDVATVDATPSDPNDAESTHAIVVPLESAAESPGSPFRDVVVDYSVGAPTADVSNVGAGTIERIGIDRGSDDPGTRIDVAANVSTVSGKKDGAALRIATAGEHTLQQGDEVVVVLRPVQNPQNAGTAEVSTTINSQNAADIANGSVTYEYNGANVTFEDQSTTGETVTVSSVTLSEGGFVAVQNSSGASADAIRGASTYLSAGTHEDVTVQLDPAIENDTELVVQAYTDANGDRRFEYDSSGGEEDIPYRTRDGNLNGSDAAQVTHEAGDTTTATPTPTPTATPTDDGDTTPTPTPTDDSDTTPTPTATPTPTDDSDTTDDGDTTPTPTATPTDDGGDDGGMTPTPTASDDGEAWESGTLVTPTPTETDQRGMNTPTATATPTTAMDETDTTSPTATATPIATDDMDGTSTDDSDETPGGTETDGQAGFGLLVALVALAGAALLARRTG